MTEITVRETDQRELARFCGLVGPTHSAPGDAIILVTLGPSQIPARIAIKRSAWPSRTALNYSEGREFHLRLRQHEGTGVYLVYGSVTRPDGSLIQRGHLCRTLADVERVIPLLRKELGLPDRPGQLDP
jgi:hypothetical protein